jgi:PAS domain S-box-containing protein
MRQIRTSARLIQLLSPPVFEDEEKTRVAALVHGILWVVVAGAVVLPVLLAVAHAGESGRLASLLSFVMILLVVGLKLLLHRGYVRLAGTLLALAVWTSFTVPMYLFDGIRDTTVGGYYLAIVITSLVLGGRTLVLFTLLASLSILAVYGAEVAGLLTTSFEIPPSSADLIVVLVVLNATALLAGLTVRRMARGERTLREERDKAQRYLDIAGAIIVALDAEHNIILVNQRGCALLGFGEDEIVGQDWIEHFVPTRVRKETNIVFERLMAGEIEMVDYYENPVLTCGGEERLIAWHNTVLRDDQGRIMGSLSSGQDITERQRAAQALQESEEKLRLIFENAFDGISIQEELPATRSRRLVDCNERYAEMAGRSKQELLEIQNMGLVQQNLGPVRSREENLRLRREKVSYRGLFAWLRPDNRENVIEYTAVPVEVGDRPLTIGIDRDITARVHAERKLQEYAERLEEMVEERTAELRAAQEQLVRREKLAVLGQLAGGVGHDLRNPLAVISNVVYLLRMVHGDGDEMTRENLDLIDEQVRVADAIVGDLLDFARTREPERQAVDVGALVGDVLGKQPPPEEVTVVSDIDPGLPPAWVDPRQVEQALVNLVTNAYQAMPEGGQLAVRGEQSGDARPDAGRWIRVAVSDSGVGILPEHMARLFEPLFTTKARGIGLGLATSRNLVEANGGRIEVHSVVGEGTTFTLWLPARESVS